MSLHVIVPTTPSPARTHFAQTDAEVNNASRVRVKRNYGALRDGHRAIELKAGRPMSKCEMSVGFVKLIKVHLHMQY